ncbi:PAS domain S-box-containing protein/diguanylate cyclase (GGDEF) domain-containing protein [Rhodovulum sp. ES.010]|uniref:sensor domain-containing protein n=1 Tax=Rhodovulum sp. ES.010 TaxID=1882821 RepID=UPI000927F287|nr:PAS domain-containing protein [Rhodovulum sp. ES.010]SIO38413.1 PAS domain S-box-containing protein/diguanylate cyclase (GGDEF) domain-containing protein [Rhodovulum sp. ES.010]
MIRCNVDQMLDQMQVAIDQLQAPAWIVSPDGTVLGANAAAVALLGCGAGRMVGLTDRDLLEPRFRDAMEQARRRMLDGGADERFSGCFFLQDGTLRNLDCTIAVIRAEGRVAALLVQVQGAPRQLACCRPQGLARPACDAYGHHREFDILRKAAAVAGFGQWYFDVPRGRIFATETYYAMLGYAPGEVELESAWVRARIHPEDRQAAIEAMERLIGGQADIFRVDYRLRCKDGAYKWFAATACKYNPGDSAEAEIVCGSLVEISDRKAQAQTLEAALADARQARDEAQRMAELMRVSHENSNVVAWMRIPATGEGWFGENLAALLGLKTGEPIDADRFRALIHPEDRERALDGHAAIEAGQTDAFACDFRLRHADGSWRWMTSAGRRIDRAAHGLPDMVCGSLTDITPIKEHQAQLSEALAHAEAARNDALASEEVLRTAALSGEIGYWTICPDDGGGWAPDETYHLLGYAPGAFPSSHAAWSEVIHPEDRPGAIAAMEDLLHGRTDLYEAENRKRHADGSYRWYRVVARRIDRSDRGLPPLVAGVLISIDRDKENEARLEAISDEIRAAHERLSTMAENAPGALFAFQINADGTTRFPYCTSNMPQLMGVSLEALQADGDVVFRHIPPDDREAILDTFRTAEKTWSRAEFRHRVDHPDLGQRWILASAGPAVGPDGRTTFYGNAVDITERLEVENRAAEAAEEVRRAHERLSSVASIAPVGLYEFRRRPDGTFDFPYTTGRFCSLMGFDGDRSQGLGAEALDRVHPDDFAAMMESIDESWRTLGPWSLRFRVRHPDRGEVWLAGASTPRRQEDGTVVWTGAVYDVTADVAREHELRRAHKAAEDMRIENERQALHDGLTGLPNRRYYDQVLTDRVKSAARGLGPRDCVLIRIDLDHFKYVNDTLGHEAGDLVLRHVGKVLRESIRASDFVARIGGDEFTIILAPFQSPENARALVERIQARLREPFMYQGRQCRFGASFGIAHTQDIVETNGELQVFVDAALYCAKTGGRNRMAFFTEDLHESILDDRRLAASLHEALENDEFFPVFQPQVSARDGRLVGIETLLRWRHPTRGLLAPPAFMHVADQLGIVPEIDALVLEKSREALARWRARGLFVPKIAFNVSSGRMHDPNVVAAARAIADEETNVAFELLESILVEEESDAFKFHLDLVREAGIDIEIDDFGSGHASIIGLMEIAPSALKIDKRIVTPVARDTRSRHLVRAIVEIAETLGIATVAEGVETARQAEILRGLGCCVLQGFLFSKPLAEAELFQFASGTAPLSA